MWIDTGRVTYHEAIWDAPVADAVIKPSLRWRTVLISCWVCWLTGDGTGVDGNGGLGEGVELLDSVEDEGTEEVDDPNCSATLGISELGGELGRAVAEEEVSEERRRAWAWAGRKIGDAECPDSGRGGTEKARLRVAK